jgi:hypothetical protein
MNPVRGSVACCLACIGESSVALPWTAGGNIRRR